MPAKLRGPHLGVPDTSNTKRDFKRDLGPVSQTGGEAARCIQMWLLGGIDVAWCSLKIPENQYDIMEYYGTPRMGCSGTRFSDWK